MTSSGVNDTPKASEAIARPFRLRAEFPRVTQLSRKVLAGSMALALAVISGAFLWALQNNRAREQVSEQGYTTDHHNVADALAGLPRDYAGVSRRLAGRCQAFSAAQWVQPKSCLDHLWWMPSNSG
jgi:hypothetical protein